MLDKTTIREWMTSPVLTITPEAAISHAHSIMKENHIRRLPVVDQQDRLVGILTIGDVREANPSDATTLSIWELNYLWSQLTVGKIMSHEVIVINPDKTIFEAAKLMLDHKISGIPVVDESGKMVGIITESDIFRMVVRLGIGEAS
ncbi:MAG: CBS domain-containing protein [Anaerolineaceae bacterium]|nr:CBS domain-containing protein [Anaerolineaceae bacterium]